VRFTPVLEGYWAGAGLSNRAAVALATERHPPQLVAQPLYLFGILLRPEAFSQLEKGLLSLLTGPDPLLGNRRLYLFVYFSNRFPQASLYMPDLLIKFDCKLRSSDDLAVDSDLG